MKRRLLLKDLNPLAQHIEIKGAFAELGSADAIRSVGGVAVKGETLDGSADQGSSFVKKDGVFSSAEILDKEKAGLAKGFQEDENLFTEGKARSARDECRALAYRTTELSEHQFVGGLALERFKDV